MKDLGNEHARGCLLPRHPALRRPLLGHLEMSCEAQGATASVLKSQQGALMTYHGREAGARPQPKSEGYHRACLPGGSGRMRKFPTGAKTSQGAPRVKGRACAKAQGLQVLQLQIQPLLLIITISQLTLVENAMDQAPCPQLYV